MVVKQKLETAVFAAGCFWGVEEVFRQVKGVKETQVGYTGGHTENPTYEAVCTGNTGHAESIEIKFDPKLTSFKKLLDVFWSCIDPTTPNQQGPDVGSQYRAAIFYHGASQKKVAEASRTAKQKEYNEKIVVEITKATTFWKAEEYHQRYLQKRGGMGYCHIDVKQILKEHN